MHTCVVGQSKTFRAALTRLLEDTEFSCSTGGADSLAELSTRNGPVRRDQMVLLVTEPDRSQLFRHVEMLKARLVPPWIVFFARTLDTSEMADIFASGVDGYLLERISPQALIRSLKLVTLGVKVLPSQIVSLMIASHWRNSPDRGTDTAYFGVLSEREAEVVKCVMLGMPNKVIAWQLCIAETTVKVHVKNILKKVGLGGRTQLAIWALQEEIGPLPGSLEG